MKNRAEVQMTVWIYSITRKQVGDKDHLKVFASEDAVCCVGLYFHFLPLLSASRYHRLAVRQRGAFDDERR